MVGCIFKENVQIWGGVAPTSMKRGYVGKNEARCDYMGGAQTRLVCRVRNVVEPFSRSVKTSSNEHRGTRTVRRLLLPAG